MANKLCGLGVKAASTLIVIMLFTGGSCGSDGDTEAGIAAIIEQAQQQVDQAEAGAETSTSPDSAATSDFQTIWQIAPFGTPSQDAGFGAYSEIDDAFQFSQDVTFNLSGTDRDTVVQYYTGLMTDMGYAVTELELGGSIALNLSLNDDPMLFAVIQIGPASPTDPTIVVHQQRTQMKTQPDASTPNDSGSEAIDSAEDSLEAG